MIKAYNVNENLNVVGLSLSNSISADTITGVTFFGNIDAKYIGSGQTIGQAPSAVTNTEFTYLSGLTGFIQPQINNKVPIDSPLITYSSSTLLNNYKIITGGTNIQTQITNNNLVINSNIGSLEVGVVDITTGGDENYSISNLNPNGWSETYPNRATSIVINPINTIKISGLSGGTSGRIATISNNGPHLIIIENNGLNANSGNKFLFSNSKAFFLTPKSSITFVYIDSYWRCISSNNENGLSVFDDMFSVPGFQVQGLGFNSTNVPYQSQYYYIYGQNGGASTSGGINFRGEGSNSTASVRIATQVVNDLTQTYQPRVRLGFGPNINNNVSGSSQLYVTRLKFDAGLPINSVSNSNSRGVTIGFENSYSSVGFKDATNNGTRIGQFSGGSFWYFDVSANTNNFLYVVQTTGNTTISALTSTLTVSDINPNYADVGVYSLWGSGGTPNIFTFFWQNATLAGTSGDNFKIESPVITYNNDILGIPGNNFYAGYGTRCWNNGPTTACNADRVTSMYVDWIGYTYTQNCFS